MFSESRFYVFLYRKSTNKLCNNQTSKNKAIHRNDTYEENNI